MKSVHADYSAVFNAVGDTHWIQYDRSRLLNAADHALQHVMRVMRYSPPHNLPVTITLISKDDTSYTFYAWAESKFKYFELTCSELQPITIPKANIVVSVDSLKLGMPLQRADGTYIVIGFDNQHVYLGAMVDATTMMVLRIRLQCAPRFLSKLLKVYCP